MPRARILATVISLLLLSSLISCVGGGQPTGNEIWSLVKLVLKDEPINNVVPETVEVRNCGVPETKTTNCSAGTTNSLSLDLGGNVQIGEGVSVTIDSSVSSSLGIGQQSGQSIALDVPPSGYIYTYNINKSYSVINGKAVARSSTGTEQNVNYVFNASCSISIISRVRASCSNTGTNIGGDTNSVATQIYTFAPFPTSTPITYPTYTPSSQSFSPLTFCYKTELDSLSFQCTRSRTIFDYPTVEVCASWIPLPQYQGSSFKRVWENITTGEVFSGEDSNTYGCVYWYRKEGLSEGQYEIKLFVNNVVVQTGSFAIQK